MTRSAPDNPMCRTGPRRRGTILVFVLGILTLLALVGLVLITRTHGEAQRVALDADAQSARSMMNGVIRGIQETLWRDVWGPNPDPIHPMPLDSNRPAFAPGVVENNEPFDAPGPDDRWLASTLPYMLFETNPNAVIPDRYGDPKRVPTFEGQPRGTASDYEELVLVWPRVSYLGHDLLDRDGWQFGAQPFCWPINSRENPEPPPGTVTPDVSPVFYGQDLNQADSKLSHVPILQTPPWTIDLPLIPGSTTNMTIAEAREVWQSAWNDPQNVAAFQAATLNPDAIPRFPYFDTNADGVLDLYDATGDGIPDSPISFVIHVDSNDPNAPRQLYAAVRIVDHGSMLNVNVATSMALPNGAPVFNESLPGLQRRGHSPTELLLDEVVHRSDRFRASNPPDNNRTGRMIAHRNNGAFAGEWPTGYDDDVVRRILSGGVPSGADSAVRLYGLSDEASLRHRGLLVPYARRHEFDIAGFTTIDRALPNTLQWTRRIDPSMEYDYSGGQARWARFNAQWGDLNLYEGYDVGGTNIKGWRTLLTEGEPYAVRRPLLTTISHAVDPPPSLHHLLFMNINPSSFPFTSAVQQADESELEFVQRKFRERGMDWPILGAPRFQGGATLSGALAAVDEPLPDWARVGRIDLNMSDGTSPAGAKQDFIRYAAGAMYAALEGVNGYQGHTLDPNIAEGQFNREYFAWQFAVNLADYRDHDDDPTILEWPPGSGQLIYGVEKQPFFTEAYAHVEAGPPVSTPSPVSRPGDRWFFAVELFVPPHWVMPIDRLYIRTRSPNSASNLLLPLSSFLSVNGNSPPSGVINSNDERGRFIVLCGATVHAPTNMDVGSFYRNTQFRIPTDGTGSVELVYSATGLPGDATEHVHDIIGPRLAGRVPTAGSPAPMNFNDFINNSPGDEWARNPGLNEGDKYEFSLLRSTLGWRFTTAWHAFAHGRPSSGPSPVSRPPTGVRQSLGLPNDTSDTLDRFLPEAPWPARQLANPVNPAAVGPVPDSFFTDLPYRDFDSVADLSRMLMIGPLRRQFANDPPYLSGYQSDDQAIVLIPPGNVPTTEMLAEIVARGGSVSDLMADPPNRITAGRIDFSSAPVALGRRWSHRLASFFTPRSMMFDGIDNDGSGLAGLNDPAEAARLLFRKPGTININTAPVSVLRSVPFMTLLPDSPEFVEQGFGAGSPADDLFNPSFTGRFWDFATAIVARRENRAVPLRLWNAASQRMETASVARRSVGLGRPSPADSGPFRDLLELANLRQITGPSGTTGDPHTPLFRIDRFTFRPENAALDLWSRRGHTDDPNNLGPIDLFSPDFWSRRLDTDQDGNFDSNQDVWVYEHAVRWLLSGSFERSTGGIRARDIFLSRWSNVLSVRSDVFTAYIVLIDEDGNYIQRSQVTLDRSECFRRPPVGGQNRNIILPRILARQDGSYTEAGR